MWECLSGEWRRGRGYLRACAFVGTAAVRGMPVTMVVRCMLPDGDGLVSFGDCVVFWSCWTVVCLLKRVDVQRRQTWQVPHFD
jgi:hypothetical protein